jgi:hypothetical protein
MNEHRNEIVLASLYKALFHLFLLKKRHAHDADLASAVAAVETASAILDSGESSIHA